METKNTELMPLKEFDRYVEMSTDELNAINVNPLPRPWGELIMILANPREETDDELKNIYVLEVER